MHVHGLKGSKYLDNLDERVRKPESADVVRFSAEVDRIYAGTHETIQARHVHPAQCHVHPASVASACVASKHP